MATTPKASMDPNKQKEQFSNAYLYAVASTAGYKLDKPELDDDSIDWTVKGYKKPGMQKRPQLELQLKCTSRKELLQDDRLCFDLKIKNYDDLRPSADELYVPRILVVVFVPDNVSEWLAQSEEKLIMYRCAYWLSLRGFPEVDNERSARVTLPRANLFTVETLQGIMGDIGKGVWP